MICPVAKPSRGTSLKFWDLACMILSIFRRFCGIDTHRKSLACVLGLDGFLFGEEYAVKTAAFIDSYYLRTISNNISEIHSAQESLDNYAAKNGKLREEIEKRDGTIQNLSAAITDRDHELARKAAESEMRNAELYEMRKSFSWRITKPIRCIQRFWRRHVLRSKS
jgi:hypothetical protein